MSARIYTLQITSALVLTIGALWAGTQWAAAMLGYQPALGAPWVDLLGFKIYAPWKLFVWWLAFDAQAPDVFVRAGGVAAFGGLASGAVAIGGTARRASLKKQATTYLITYDAKPLFWWSGPPFFLRQNSRLNG